MMALTVSPGQAVGQPDWDALAAQHGGVKGNPTKVAPSEAQIKEAGMVGDDDPAFQQRPIYRYYFNDGTYVDARTAANGADYAVVEYKPSSQFTGGNTAAAQSREKPTTGRVEGTPVPGGGFDNSKPIWVERDANGQQVGAAKPLTADQRQQWERDKNGGKTDAELRAENESKEDRKPVATHPGYTQVTTQKGGKTETYYLDPNGNRVNGLPEKPTTATLVGSPTGNTRQRNEGGQVIKEAEYVLPNGTKEWRTQTAPAPPDKDAWAPEPAGAPDLPTMIGQFSSGLLAYSKWLDQQTELYRTSGGKEGVSPENATKLMVRRVEVANDAVKEQQHLESTQSGQRGQDINQRGQTIGETQSRRQMAQTIAADVNRRADERFRYILPEHVGTHLAARQEEMQNALAYAAQWGGLRESPEIDAAGFPALAAARQASMAGMPSPGAPTPTMGPQTIAAPPPAPPNAIGLGALGPQPAPGAPPVAAAAAPSAPMQAAAVNPIDQSPIVVPSQLPQPSAPPVRDDWRREPGLTPPSPNVAVPGGPMDETGALPFVPPDQYQPAAPVNMDPSQGPVGRTPSPRWMQETRFGEGVYFDPDLASADLIMRLGINPAIMEQARRGLYG
jgi:hypothetical protein